jgi:hypothetical protein
MGEGETFTFLSGEGQRAGNAEHVEECIYFFVVPRFALHFGLQQRGIGFVLLPTQGSQPQFTLGYSHAVPPNARPSDLEERRSGGPDGMLLLVIGLSCAPETGSIPRDGWARTFPVMVLVSIRLKGAAPKCWIPTREINRSRRKGAPRSTQQSAIQLSAKSTAKAAATATAKATGPGSL